MTKEELQKMEKPAIIDIVLKLENEMHTREIMNKHVRDERDRLNRIIDATKLILNNV